MQTINLTTTVGLNSTSVTAKVGVYGITETGSDFLLSIDQTSTTTQFSIDEKKYSHFWLSARITEFTESNSGTTSVPSSQWIQFLTLFEAGETAVCLNERLTMASMFCLAQFIDINPAGIINITDPEDAVKLTFGMRNNFMASNGDLSEVISRSPNNMETNSYPLWNSLSNLLYNALKTPSIYSSFIDYTSFNIGVCSFAQGLFEMIQNPFENVSQIYSLIANNPSEFTPALADIVLPNKKASRQPDQWTLAIKVNRSGATNFLISGAAYVAFDKNDNGWLANNVRQGTPNSAPCGMVFKPDGSPADFSPVFGGGLLGAGFGVCVDNTGENIYYGNFGWGPTQCNPQKGGLAHFSINGNAISTGNGYTNKLSRVQGLNFDRDGNLWITSWGNQDPLAPADSIYNFQGENSSIVVYLQGDENNALQFFFTPESQFYNTFDVVIDDAGYAYVSLSGNYNKDYPGKRAYSGVYKLKINADKTAIDFIAKWDFTTDPSHFEICKGYDAFRQINLDSEGNVYVGAIKSDSNRIIKLTSDLEYIKEFTEHINRPWGVTIDKNDTIYAGNFGAELEDNPAGGEHAQLPLGSTGVTVIKRDKNGVLTHNLMTLPTGGRDVHLANGFRLYGQIGTYEYDYSQHVTLDVPIIHPCYTPLMRITSSSIDRAGNLWVMNNWKPSAAIDLLQNPGGDGIVIFIGVAAPEPNKFN